MQKVLSFDDFLFEAESPVYTIPGDPYSYKVIDGVWYTKGKNIKTLISLAKYKSSTELLNKKFPDALKSYPASGSKAAAAGAAAGAASKVAAKSKVTPDSTNPNASVLFNGEELIWSVKKGSTYSPIKSWTATSGLSFLNAATGNEWWLLAKSFVQSPEMFSKEKNAGPTPPGKYLIGLLETRRGTHEEVSSLRALYKKIFTDEYDNPTLAQKDFQNSGEYSRIGWGNFRAAIYAKPGTNTFGRGGFYVHGGTFPGSHGCIDLTGDMDDFAKFYGTWLAANPTKKGVDLTVDYGDSLKNRALDYLWSSNEIKGIDLPTDEVIADAGTFDEDPDSDYSNIA